MDGASHRNENPPRSGGTRERLIAAAEDLIAESGLDGISMRDVIARAGAGNASAIRYHFDGRGGLIQAVIDKHNVAVETRRHAILDQIEAGGPYDLRALAGALVRPLAAELSNEDGGIGYLRLMADLINRPHPTIDPASVEDPSNSLYRWRQLVEPLLSPNAIQLHRRLTAVRFVHVELARRGYRSGRRHDRLFISQLIDLVAGLLNAPVSDETERNLGGAEPPRSGAP